MIAFRNTQTQYGWIARILHWTSVALVFTTVVIAVQSVAMEGGPEKEAALTNHAALGIAILCIMSARLYWRTVNVNPVDSYELPHFYKLLAKSLHRGLYCVVLALVLTGILQAVFRGEPLAVARSLGLDRIVTPDVQLGELWHDIHVRMTYALYLAVAAHALGAIVHQIFGVKHEADEGENL